MVTGSKDGQHNTMKMVEERGDGGVPLGDGQR